MPIDNLRLQRINTTIVYQKLDIHLVSLDGLRTVLPDAPRPMVVNFPDAPLIVQYPNGVLLQLHDPRLRLDDPSGKSPLDSALLEMLGPVVAAVGQADLVAYGHNYDVSFSLRAVKDSGAMLMDMFVGDPGAIGLNLGGRLDRVKQIELTYGFEDSQHNLRLQAPSSPPDNVLLAHLNVHYVDREAVVSDKGLLGKELMRHYERLQDSLASLFAK